MEYPYDRNSSENQQSKQYTTNTKTIEFYLAWRVRGSPDAAKGYSKKERGVSLHEGDAVAIEETTAKATEEQSRLGWSHSRSHHVHAALRTFGTDK